MPVDPESTHKAEGCRIGGRLDIVLGTLAKLPKTKDGVPIVSGVTIYIGETRHPWMVRGIVVDDGGEFASLYGPGRNFARVAMSELFATDLVATSKGGA